MVSQHLGQVGGAVGGDLVEPVGGALMAGDPFGTRQSLVAHVADQDVPEAVLRLTGHRGRRLFVDQIPLFQPAKRPLDRVHLPCVVAVVFAGKAAEVDAEFLRTLKNLLEEPGLMLA